MTSRQSSGAVRWSPQLARNSTALLLEADKCCTCFLASRLLANYGTACWCCSARLRHGRGILRPASLAQHSCRAGYFSALLIATPITLALQLSRPAQTSKEEMPNPNSNCRTALRPPQSRPCVTRTWACSPLGRKSLPGTNNMTIRLKPPINYSCQLQLKQRPASVPTTGNDRLGQPSHRRCYLLSPHHPYPARL